MTTLILDDDAASGVTAIDARLAFGSSTGDSTYWTALLGAFADMATPPHIELYSDRPAPADFRLPFPWRVVPARSSRWWSLVAFPLAARRAGARRLHTQYALSPLARGGIATVHDVSFRIGPQWFSAKDRLLLDLGVRSATRFGKAVVTVSETSRREIEEHYPDAIGKTTVIHNARPPWIRPVADAAERRARMGVPEPYLLTVGTRWARKNMDLAIKAVNGLPARFPHRLLVTGKAGADGELGPRGVATGYVEPDDLSALYQGATLYLAPSWHEGFGIPILEAMACGAPVFASPADAFREVAGDAAEITRTLDPETWTDEIARLLDDPGKLTLLRERGFGRERRFTWAESAHAHAALYARIR